MKVRKMTQEEYTEYLESLLINDFECFRCGSCQRVYDEYYRYTKHDLDGKHCKDCGPRKQEIELEGYEDEIKMHRDNEFENVASCNAWLRRNRGE